LRSEKKTVSGLRSEKEEFQVCDPKKKNKFADPKKRTSLRIRKKTDSDPTNSFAKKRGFKKSAKATKNLLAENKTFWTQQNKTKRKPKK
jgi:hypothetical protein